MAEIEEASWAFYGFAEAVRVAFVACVVVDGFAYVLATLSFRLAHPVLLTMPSGRGSRLPLEMVLSTAEAGLQR